MIGIGKTAIGSQREKIFVEGRTNRRVSAPASPALFYLRKKREREVARCD
jgi:hypothetical protein